MKNPIIEKGAEFSPCGKYRYSLWRIWDADLSAVMFIGLNPSKAGADQDDPTIRKVCRIAANLGYGGIYMVNCFPYISTFPRDIRCDALEYNDLVISVIAEKVSDVVFAWGNFWIVKDTGRDARLKALFPQARALHINQNGSPKHPLYCSDQVKLIPYESKIA